VREQEQQELVTRLAAEFPIFARATIARWVAHEAARYRAADVADHAGPVSRSVRATLEELSRQGVATADELPVARSVVVADEAAVTEPRA
jgi:hypothetical protein